MGDDRIVPERGKNIRAYITGTEKQALTIGHTDGNMRCEPVEVGCNPLARILSAAPQVVQGSA